MLIALLLSSGVMAQETGLDHFYAVGFETISDGPSISSPSIALLGTAAGSGIYTRFLAGS